jgi:hypothetical protein
MNASTVFRQSPAAASASACLPEPEARFFDLFRCRPACVQKRVSLAALRVACTPALESLGTRGVGLALCEAETVARFEAPSGKLHLGRQITGAILGLRPETRWALLECIARWAIARIAVDQSGLQHGADAKLWTIAFAMRPLLYSYWKNGCLPCGWIEISSDLEKIIQRSCREKNYHHALQSFRGSLEQDNADARAFERERFKHPRWQIVHFRHTQDGVVLPLFGGRKTSYISPYNPPREPARQQQWRIHTSNIILAARDFSLPLSKAEVRKPLHVPLQLVPACSIHHSLAGTPSRSVSELLGPGMVPITTRNADGSPWSVLMYGSEIYENEIHAGCSGRTGILFKDARPVIEESDGIEHLVELKGMGCATGGMPSVMKRSDGTWCPTGGLLQSYAMDEHAALQEHAGAGIGPKPAALLTFSAGPVLRQPSLIGAGDPERKFAHWPEELRAEISERLNNGLGLVVRLTPSVERLSFFETSETTGPVQKLGGLTVPERISLYGAAVGRLFRKGQMTAHLSAHLENIVAGEFGFFWQDFADIVPLYISRAHQKKPAYLSRKKLTMDLLNQVFFYVARTAQVFHEYFSVPYAEFSKRFYEAFLRELKATWEITPAACAAILETREPLRIHGEGITLFLWKEFIACDNFHWCLRSYDLPAPLFPAPLFRDRSAQQAEDETISPGLALTFLEGEKEFLQDASLNCCLSANQGSTTSISLLKESLRRVESLLERLHNGHALKLADCKLPYLSESEKAPLPRKIESWPK